MLPTTWCRRPARSNSRSADPGPDMVLARSAVLGPAAVQINSHARGSADFAHVVNPGVKVFGLTTHEHHFGTLATIDLATSASGAGSELYRNTDWEHPPLKPFEPALEFDGTQSAAPALRLVQYLGSDPVPFGLSAATNEMCFFWAYYYPSQGFQACVEDGCCAAAAAARPWSCRESRSPGGRAA